MHLLPDIIGYAAVFNQRIDMGLWTEEVLPGAFTETISRSDDVAALFNHDPNLVLGRTPNTLSLRQDDHGLHMTIQPPDIEIGRSVVKVDRAWRHQKGVIWLLYRR
jgi:HK97 family phage prohead protease